MPWHKIAQQPAELFTGNGGLTELTIEGKTICIAVKDQDVFACAATCPHAGGRLAGGHIDAMGNIVCPVHRYRFSLKNGRNTSGEGYYLKTFPVEIRPDGVFVQLEIK